MNNQKILILLTILLVAGGTLFFLPSDEKKVRKNMVTLADSCSSTRKEPPIEMLMKAALSARLCSNPCLVQIASFNINREFNNKEFSDHIFILKKH